MNYDEMTLEEAIHNLEVDEKFCQASGSRNCEEFKIAISCIKKQISKKPYKIREHNKNDYYCTICKRYLGNEMELKHDCLKPEYCQHCGQKIKW